MQFEHDASQPDPDPLRVRSLEGEPKDTDASAFSPHHTLGFGKTQAAPGWKVRELEKRIAALESQGSQP
jgi:hypothetical protein